MILVDFDSLYCYKLSFTAVFPKRHLYPRIIFFIQFSFQIVFPTHGRRKEYLRKMLQSNHYIIINTKPFERVDSASKETANQNDELLFPSLPSLPHCQVKWEYIDNKGGFPHKIQQAKLVKAADILHCKKVERWVLVIRRGRYSRILKQRVYRLTLEKVVVTWKLRR